MIKQWSVTNFKSIRGNAVLDFAPLTLFVGQNSAGKSTLIQSILLTAQTIQSNATARSVVLNGRIIRLGSFEDICANNAVEKQITVSFTLSEPVFGDPKNRAGLRGRYYYGSEYREKLSAIRASYTFSAGSITDGQKELQLQPRLEDGSVIFYSTEDSANVEFEFKRRDKNPDLFLNELGVTSENVRIANAGALEYEAVKSSMLSKSFPSAYRVPRQATPVGVLLKHFLPVAVAASYDAVSEEVDAIFDMLVDTRSSYRHRDVSPGWVQVLWENKIFKDIVTDAYTNSIQHLTDYFRSKATDAIQDLTSDFTLDKLAKAQGLLQVQGKKAFAIQLNEREAELKRVLRNNRSERKEIAAFPVSEAINYSAEYVSDFFSENVKYLGPLRDEPKAIYPLAGYNDPSDIGFKGEFTAAVLENNRASQVSYVPSRLFPFSNMQDLHAIECTLGDAVRDWLSYLGIAARVATADKGKLGHELTIATAENLHLHDLTHVGVGVSQALPIVVLSLLSPPGSTLIFEQPELHLNPKVQTRLADFFASLIFCGKQCIIETHSEYLISRLRYLAAMSKDVPIAQSIKIYSVEKPLDQSIYREVEVQESGVIKNWPEGFFDETERNAEALIRAQIEKARAQRAGKGKDSK